MAHYDLALQRKQEIENNLLALMQETPYDRITVKDMTDSLQIARKTFYHYFHNKQACLESLMDRLILESNLTLTALPKEADSWDIYAEYLQFWIRNKAFLEAVSRNHLSFLFMERAILYLRRENRSVLDRLSTDTLYCDEDILYGYISGQVCLILKWCREGFSRPLEDMVRISLRLAQEPLLPREVMP
jgi:AcrR family transcriptional regulator